MQRSLGAAALLALPSVPVVAARGRTDEILRFDGTSRRTPGRLRGAGLSGRRMVDLTRISAGGLVVANDEFFIRTACPDTLPDTSDWTIRVHGLVERERRLEIAQIREAARPMGTHLVECSGRGVSGLISAANWTGVPLAELLRDEPRRPGATRVLLSGFDEHPRWNPNYDERGCNWVLTLEDLERTGAFLATAMNEKPLPRHNGFPVRVIVPGWYGCTCVKWLNEIRFVDDSAPATRHMRQFARRTHQRGTPRMARDFRAAEIDLAAMPVRVERSTENGGLTHRIVGILWGGKAVTDRLTIRIDARSEAGIAMPVEDYVHEAHSTWTTWSHTWRPARTGRYTVRLAVDDPSVRTRRLDRGDYARRVMIERV